MQSNQLSFKNIIVGVDFSPYSKVALKQAKKLAAQFHAHLTLVHSASLPVTFESDYYLMRNITVDFNEIRKSIGRYYEIRPSSKVSFVVKEGEPTETLISIAKKMNAPLIVVGSQGKGAVSRFLLGSVAEKLAKDSPYPVWVHRGRKVVPLHKIVVPTDLSVRSKELMKKLKNWKIGKNISFKYLFVRPMSVPMINYPQYQEAMDRIQEDLKKTMKQFISAGPRIELETVEGEDPAEKISQIGHQYDVIAMSPHQHPGLFSSFGKVTSKVMRLAHNPVLVVKT